MKKIPVIRFVFKYFDVIAFLIAMMLVLMVLNCSTNRHIQLEQAVAVSDSVSVQTADSTAVHVERSENTNIAESVETIIEETITEVVKDTTDNVVVGRVIKRQIKQTAGKGTTNTIVEKADTTTVSKEITQETRSAEATQSFEETKKESSKLKYIFLIALVALIGYLVFKFKK